MSTYTPNLDLLEKNPTTEGSDLFNIGTMLNDNWDKVDAYTALVAASIAPIYSTSSAYSVGDYCTHGGKLYRCTSDIGSGGEAWNDNHWTAVDIETLLAGINSDIAGKAPTSHAASATTYGKGDGTNYGHLKLSDATDSSSDATGGIAATPKAVKTVEDAKADKTALATFVRPNLLDNWYFVGGGSQQGGGQFPINTRGQTSYSVSNAIGIDRWEQGNPALTSTLNSTGISIANASTTSTYSFLQRLTGSGSLRGKTITGTALLSNGSLLSGTKSIPSEVPSSGTIYNLFSSGLVFRLEVQTTGDVVPVLRIPSSTTIEMAAIKLELGDTQTLAHQENGVWVLNEIPNYQQELEKCQRYQIELVPPGNSAIGCIGGGTPTSSTQCYVFVPTPTELRTVPTLTYAGTWKLVREGTAPASGASVSAMSVVNRSTNGVTLQITSSGLSTSCRYDLWYTAADATNKLLLSANL